MPKDAASTRSKILTAAVQTLRRGGCSAGLIDRSARNAHFEDAARDAVIDGSAIALAAGVPLADTKDAYDALWLTLLDITEKT